MGLEIVALANGSVGVMNCIHVCIRTCFLRQ